MNRKNIFLFLALLAFVIFCVYWLQIGYAIIPLREGLYLASSFLAVVGGIFALHMYGFKGEKANTLILLSAGMGYWFFGELLFSYYQFVLHVNPFPSVADIFYVLAYPILLAGLLNEIKISQIRWDKLHKSTFFLFIFSSVLLAVIVIYLGIYQAYNPSANLLVNSIAIGYGVGDLLLIVVNMLVLILVWEYRGGNLSRIWVALFLGFICTLIADILFAFYTNEYQNTIWFYKSLLDSFWIAGYLLFAYGLFDFGFSILNTYRRINLFHKNKK